MVGGKAGRIGRRGTEDTERADGRGQEAEDGGGRGTDEEGKAK